MLDIEDDATQYRLLAELRTFVEGDEEIEQAYDKLVLLLQEESNNKGAYAGLLFASR